MVIDEFASAYTQYLRGFLDGDQSLDTLRQIVAQVQWDTDVSSDFKDGMARIGLFALELAESLRPEEELRAEIAALLGSLNVLRIRAGTGTRDFQGSTYVLDSVPALNRV